MPRTSGFFKNKSQFLPKVLLQAAKLPGKSCFFKKINFLEKSSAPSSETARDKLLLPRKINDFLENVLPQAAKLPRSSGFFRKSRISEKKYCPRQRSCPRHVASSKKVGFLRKSSAPGLFKKSLNSEESSAPGSEAARDKWLLQKN